MKLAAAPEDFVVEELPLFAPSGEGAHTYLEIEKRGLDTDRVARALAREAGVAAKEVGDAGRKDRHAITRQWFSVPGLDPGRAAELAEEGDAGFRVLRAIPHAHKLRTGQLRGNRFTLCVREIGAAERARAEVALPRIREEGFPNRFGAQRFGRDGDNAERGREILLRGRVGRDRKAARFLVSAWQADLFNRFLARRPEPLDRLLPGELAWKHDSGACFVVEDAEAENARAAAFEISPTGPLVGTRMSRPEGEAGDRERAWLTEWGVPDPLVAPRGLRLRGARRPLRVPAQGLTWTWEDVDVLRLEFELGAGSYATVVVESLVA